MTPNFPNEDEREYLLNSIYFSFIIPQSTNSEFHVYLIFPNSPKTALRFTNFPLKPTAQCSSPKSVNIFGSGFFL